MVTTSRTRGSKLAVMRWTLGSLPGVRWDRMTTALRARAALCSLRSMSVSRRRAPASAVSSALVQGTTSPSVCAIMARQFVARSLLPESMTIIR